MLSCAHCKVELPNSQKFCNTCGTPVMALPNKEARTAYRHCGHTLPARQYFCNKCGTPVAASTNIDEVNVESSLPTYAKIDAYTTTVTPRTAVKTGEPIKLQSQIRTPAER
ncbi:hypothetical protein [Mycetohabitans sp. B46]|uniref:hypothetical protein n=1 Tax=Mycetohabitans sp. B46 TaxID=2772536 RepID=UPI00307F6248